MAYKLVIPIADLKAAATTILYKETIGQGQAGYKVLGARLICEDALTGTTHTGAKITVRKVGKLMSTGAAETATLVTMDMTASSDYTAFASVYGEAQPTETVNNTVGYREKFIANNGTEVAAFGEQLQLYMVTAAASDAAANGWVVLDLE